MANNKSTENNTDTFMSNLNEDSQTLPGINDAVASVVNTAAQKSVEILFTDVKRKRDRYSNETKNTIDEETEELKEEKCENNIQSKVEIQEPKKEEKDNLGFFDDLTSLSKVLTLDNQMQLKYANKNTSNEKLHDLNEDDDLIQDSGTLIRHLDNEIRMEYARKPTIDEEDSDRGNNDNIQDSASLVKVQDNEIRMGFANKPVFEEAIQNSEEFNKNQDNEMTEFENASKPIVSIANEDIKICETQAAFQNFAQLDNEIRNGGNIRKIVSFKNEKQENSLVLMKTTSTQEEIMPNRKIALTEKDCFGCNIL